MDLTQLDTLNDVVQRAGLHDKRKRNEAIRQGMTQSNSFSSDFSPQIKEAQQPSEFLGAGRQLAQNQNMSDDLYTLFAGPMQRSGNELYYYGDNDYSTAQYGVDGYNTKDLGYGKYDILGQDGNSLGTGYMSVQDAINSYRKSNLLKGVEYVAPPKEEFRSHFSDLINQFNTPTSGWKWGENFYKTKELAEQAALREFTPYQPRSPQRWAGPLEDWEILGQLISPNTKLESFGDTLTNRLGFNAQTDNFTGSGRRMPSNNTYENITGENTLYGSLPLIYNNKLLGYKMDVGPGGVAGVNGDYNDPYHVGRTDSEGKTQSDYHLYRDINNPEAWSSVGTGLGNQDIFISPDKVKDIPGWTNKEVSEYAHQDGGFLGEVASSLGPVLNLAALFMPQLAPYAAAAGTINGINNDNPFGAVMSLAGMDFGNGSILSNVSDASNLTSTLKDISSSTGIPVSVLQGAGMNGLHSLVSGQNPLTPMIIGGLSGAAGDLAGNTFGKDFTRLGSAAASWGLNNLFNKNNQTAGVSNLYSVLASSPQNTLQPQQSQEDLDKNKQSLIRLQQLLGRQNNGTPTNI